MVPTLLEIRNLHVLFGDGRAADVRRVRCPVHARTMDLDRCLSCPESGGIARGAGTVIEYASCLGAGAGAEARREETRALGDTPLSAVMTADVLAVRPEVSLETVTEILLERGYGGAPVVDEEGRPVGVISKTDLLDRRFLLGDTGEATAPGPLASRGHLRVELGPGVHAEPAPTETVADAMTPVAFTLPENAPVVQAAAMMAARGIHRVLVVSDDGKLAGIVTGTDVLRWLAGRAPRARG